MTLVVLRTECPICGTPFTLKASRRRAEAGMVVRRCPAHRKLGLTVERHKALVAAQANRTREAELVAMFD